MPTPHQRFRENERPSNFERHSLLKNAECVRLFQVLWHDPPLMEDVQRSQSLFIGSLLIGTRADQ